MDTKEFFIALDMIEKDKGISRAIILEAFEHALVSAYKRNFNESAEIEVRIDENLGDIGIYAKKVVVSEVTRPAEEISLEEAQGINPNHELGDMLKFEVTPRDFGRIATQTAKQVVRQRLKQAERDNLVAELKEREGELVTGIVSKTDSRNAYIDLGKVEGVLPLNEVNNFDDVKPGTRVKVYISRIDARSRNLSVIVTRRDPNIIKRLFELEVPEVYDGTIKIVGVARDTGNRAKVCVVSEDENVDPIGSCIGSGGMRIKNIIDGLGGEKVDIVAFSEDPVVMVKRALSPATVKSVTVNEDDKIANVIVDGDQLSLAIGKRGQNVRLAAQLTGWKIDIKIDEEAEARRKAELASQKALEEENLAKQLDKLASMIED